MEKNTASDAPVALLGEDWFDPLEAGVRQHIRSFIEAMLESELEAALNRGRYKRTGFLQGHRHGHRDRQILGTFGPTRVSVPRARLVEADGTTRDWRNRTLPAYKRLTKPAEALIAGTYLAGTNTRRVAPTPAGSAAPWERCSAARSARTRSAEPGARCGATGRLGRSATCRRTTSSASFWTARWSSSGWTSAPPASRCWWRWASGATARRSCWACANMGGQSEAAWRAFLDDLVSRKLTTPELLIIDGAPGLEAALTALWPEVPLQRCTVHKHRNLLAHAPKTLHDEISADYTDMIYAKTVKAVEARRKAFVRKWRLKCPAVATSLEEAGANLFTFLLYPPDQWKSIRTTNAIERLHEEFKRQDTVPAALRRNRLHAVLGPARQRPDHSAPGQWLGQSACRSRRRAA